MNRESRGGRLGHLFIEALECRQLLNGGQLDTSFSSDGKAQAKFSEGFVENSLVAIDGDQTIVVGTVGKNDDIGMASFNFDGTPTAGFGTNGIVQIHPDGDSSNINVALAATVDGSGRIIVVGEAGNEMLALRFHSDGTLDKSFDHDGIVGINFGFSDNASASAVAIQPDGKIVVAGQTGFGTANFALARLNTNGSLDSTFGQTEVINHVFTHTGKTTIDFGGGSYADAVAIDTSLGSNKPRIVVSGGFVTGSNNSVTKMEILRLNSDGSLDTSFDKDGKVAFSLPTDNFNVSTGLVMQSGGKIVFTGYAGPKQFQNEVFLAARLNNNGSIDNSFGDNNDGIASVGFGGDDEATSVTQGLNGRIFLGGSAGSKIAIAALSSNGILDSSFGSGGKVTTSVSPGVDFERSVGVGYMGDRVVAVSSNETGGVANVLRYTDINPTISVSQLINNINEAGPPVAFILSSDQRLPFATQINFSIGGTATPPSLFANKDKLEDYTLTNMTIPLVGQIGHPIPPPFAIIPANQTTQLVTINPVDDTRVEGTETATFAANSSSSYTLNSKLKSVTFNILDNDGPKTTTINDTADSYVQDGSDASTNFGTSKQLVVKKAGSGFNRVTYIKFDISSLSTVSSVKLDLFGKLNDTQDPDITTSLFSVSDTSWSETGITFNNAPALSGSPLTNATVTGANLQTVEFDVTSFIKSQIAAGHKTVSLAIKDLAKSSSVVEFNSREAGSQTPALNVT